MNGVDDCRSIGVHPCNQYKVYTIPTPAAGADFSFTFPAGNRYKVISFIGTFITSAAVASRVMKLRFTKDGTEFCRIVNANATVASTTMLVSAYIDATQQNDGTNPVFPLPSEMRLEQGVKFQSIVSSIQAGDAWSGLAMLVEEIPVGPGDN